MDEGGTGDTGGNGESDTNDGWNDDNANTLWGWLDGIVSGLKTVWEAIVNLPQLIAEKVLEGIKAIFIPDAEYIDTAFNGFLNELKMKFNVDTGFFESLFSGESVVDDVYTDYNIPGVGGFHLKVFDSSYFVDGITYFRPFIRGFIVLLMALFHVKQLIGFFGYDAGVVTGRNDHIRSAREAQKE